MYCNYLDVFTFVLLVHVLCTDIIIIIVIIIIIIYSTDRK